jgi:hypothetical protein
MYSYAGAFVDVDQTQVDVMKARGWTDEPPTKEREREADPEPTTTEPPEL